MREQPNFETAQASVDALRDAIEEFKGKYDAKVDVLVDAVAALEGKANKAKFNGNGSQAAEPHDILMPSEREYRERKAQAIGSDPAGGYVVFTEAGPYFDRLRPSTVVFQARPMIVDMQSDKMLLPGLGTSTTVALVGEGTTLSESDAVFGGVELIAKKYSVRTPASSEWLSDANPDARRIIATDHIQQMGAKLDLEMLEGNSGGHIIGLRRITGVTKTELGAGNGATPTLDDVASLLYRLENANVDKSRLALFMAARTWNTFVKIKDSQNRYQLAPDPTTESRRQLFGVPVYTSSQITLTETVGGSSDCSYIVGADMSKVVVGRRLAAAVLFDPYSKSSTDQVVIQTISRWDMNVLQTAAVEVLTGVRP